MTEEQLYHWLGQVIDENQVPWYELCPILVKKLDEKKAELHQEQTTR